MQGHRDLVVWQKSMQLVTCVYRVTRCFPRDEVYGFPARSGALRFPFPVTWRKDADETLIANSVSS